MMAFFESLHWKIQKAKKMLSESRYKDFFTSVYDNLPFLPMYRATDRTLKYLYLRRKYRPIIAEHVKSNIHNGGGGTTGGNNIIWWLWLQGQDNAPDICKACLASLRRWHSDKEIITLDLGNLADYITLPDYIREKYNKGLITNTHYSDLIRSELLTKHGGIWIDSTVFCTGRKFDDILGLPFFMFRQDGFTCASSNWFIVSRANNPMIALTRDLLFAYWKDYNYTMHYFLFHMFFKMATEAYKDEWEKVPFISNKIPHEMQNALSDDYSEARMKYFAGISDFHKLTYKFRRIPSEQSIYQHIVKS